VLEYREVSSPAARGKGIPRALRTFARVVSVKTLEGALFICQCLASIQVRLLFPGFMLSPPVVLAYGFREAILSDHCRR